MTDATTNRGCMFDIINNPDMVEPEPSKNIIERKQRRGGRGGKTTEVVPMSILPRAVVTPAPIPQAVPIVPAVDLYNVLDPRYREEFRTEVVFGPTDLFSRPINTTNTMEGIITNVSFHERDLIEELIPDNDFVMYRCNYGKLAMDDYEEPVKERKTNRGRKKKDKTKKPRKKQGAGTDFNSQVTFVARSSYADKVYKFKVFRTGKIQLPGVHQSMIEDVVNCTKKVARVLNFHLHPGNPKSTIVNLSPVMKNYKFLIHIPCNHILDLDVLKDILGKDRGEVITATNEERPECPPIFMIKYTRQDTKLSIKFSTPLPTKPKKKTRINIFMRGKVNILGGFDTIIARQICTYLHWIIKKNYSAVIVSEGGKASAYNIYNEISEEELSRAMTEYIPPLPTMTEAEADSVMAFIDAVYEGMVNEILGYFS